MQFAGKNRTSCQTTVFYGYFLWLDWIIIMILQRLLMQLDYVWNIRGCNNNVHFNCYKSQFIKTLNNVYNQQPTKRGYPHLLHTLTIKQEHICSFRVSTELTCPVLRHWGDFHSLRTLFPVGASCPVAGATNQYKQCFCERHCLIIKTWFSWVWRPHQTLHLVGPPASHSY